MKKRDEERDEESEEGEREETKENRETLKRERGRLISRKVGKKKYRRERETSNTYRETEEQKRIIGKKFLLRRGRECTLVEYLETIRRYDRRRDRREYEGRKKSITQGTQVTTYLIQKLSRQSAHTHTQARRLFRFVHFVHFVQSRYIYTYTHTQDPTQPTPLLYLVSK